MAMKKPKTEKVMLNAEVSRELKARLDNYCEKNGLKLRAVIEFAILEYLEKRGG